MSFTNVPGEPGRQRTSISGIAPRTAPASSVHFQPTFTMYPLLFQAPFSPGMTYFVDGLPNQTSPMTPISPGHPALGSLYQTPPSPALTSQNNQSPSRMLSNYGRPEARRQNATRISRSPHHNAAGHHNHVDINRIREGIDVRTTVSPPAPTTAFADHDRSCSEIFPTKLTKPCLSAFLTNLAGESTTSCISVSTSPMTASK